MAWTSVVWPDPDGIGKILHVRHGIPAMGVRAEQMLTEGMEYLTN